VVSDLHAHVLGLPVVLAFILVLVLIFKKLPQLHLKEVFVLGVLLGVMGDDKYLGRGSVWSVIGNFWLVFVVLWENKLEKATCGNWSGRDDGRNNSCALVLNFNSFLVEHYGWKPDPLYGS